MICDCFVWRFGVNGIPTARFGVAHLHVRLESLKKFAPLGTLHAVRNPFILALGVDCRFLYCVRLQGLLRLSRDLHAWGGESPLTRLAAFMRRL